MNKEEFIGKLQMVYVGDRNAFNEIVEDNQRLKNLLVYSKVEIDRLNETIEKKNTYYDNLAVDYRIEHEEKNRLNNKVSELEDINEKIGLALNSAENKVDRLNNIIKELSKDVDMWNKKYNEQFDIINELEKWIKERYKKTEENSSRMKVITSLNREFYITVKNVQSDRKDVLDKLKELKENNK